jgi:hypothetical protein
MMSSEPRMPQYGYQNDEQFLKILEELDKVKQDVVNTRQWFKTHAPQQAYPFRIAGVLLILLSVSVPFIAAQTALWKDTVLSIMTLAIAALTGLSAFFRWEYAWQSYRQTQYALDRMLNMWEFKIVEARHQADPQRAIDMALRSTEQLLTDAANITSSETAEYFKHVQMPQTQSGT